MDLDFLNECPPRFVPYGCKSHPMYQQWKKMLDSCTDPKHKLFPLVGGKGITVMFRWFNFEDFVDDNLDVYDTEPAAPGTLRKIYLKRVNPKAGFNPKNIAWVSKKEACALQPNTTVVDTVYGKNMPLKELARILEARQGQDLPEGAEIFTGWVKVYNDEYDRFDRVKQEITTIQAIKLHELRRRHQKGLPLLAPIREYGMADILDNEREKAILDRMDRERPPVQHGQPQWAKERGIPAAVQP